MGGCGILLPLTEAWELGHQEQAFEEALVLSPGSWGSISLAWVPHFLSFPSSSQSPFIMSDLVNASMSVHRNSLGSQIQIQLAVAELVWLLWNAAQLVSIKL